MGFLITQSVKHGIHLLNFSLVLAQNIKNEEGIYWILHIYIHYTFLSSFITIYVLLNLHKHA